MKCFISAGVKFYMLAPGEPYPDPYEGNNYIGAYVVFPFEGQWYAQIHFQRRWQKLTDRGFSTENEAINFVYERFLSGEDKR
ncbi:hypothetical protein FMK81_24075 [Klebsiella oxytoca]|uniref:hypothetical protein n=1 Tax=Klebsiella oxytoca TaxID=571 RepID=UPI001CC95016|nr:hypothetical protein [Klebsiella oxytoca]MBZ7264567.1 hypothetical protein [Klebsiella oxytoca]MCW9548038.1 hypothetical protein [Klebsiella oxytoca]